MHVAHGTPSVLRQPPQPLRVPTPLARLNRSLAQPIAGLFGALGVAPGQLSLQSLTITAVGLVRMADATWGTVALGAAIVYLGLLFDRADLLLMERKGRPPPFIAFVGLAIDRLVEVAILVALGVLTVLGVQGTPWRSVEILPPVWTLVVCSAAVGFLLATKAIEAMAETILLRTHLLSTRRLPGPAILASRPPARSVVAPLTGRDETILLACLAAVVGQIDLGLLAIAALQTLAFLEQVVLFAKRLRDPEAEASRVLGSDYP